MPSDLDAVVIGSGIGGLSTAALLAKSGKRVLVLEQHDQAGGCCHSFVEKGFEFDVGKILLLCCSPFQCHWFCKVSLNSNCSAALRRLSEFSLLTYFCSLWFITMSSRY